MGTEAVEVRTNEPARRANRALRISDVDGRTSSDSTRPPGRPGVGEDRDSAETADGSFAQAIASVGERAGRVADGRGAGGGAITALEGVCFWTAIVVPVVYIPLLASGINTRSEALLLAGLLAINAVSLLGGHSYGE